MPDLPILTHYIAGAVTFLLFWGAVLTTKGSRAHRARGRLFFLSLLPVGISVFAILVLRSDHFDPPRMTQFAYLLLCLLTVGTVGWTAIRWKHDLDRFRGLHFRLLGLAMFGSGAVVLAAGAASRQPLAIILSSIGLVFGGAMIRFAWLHAKPHPKWWLGWHLNSVLLLSSAVYGTLLAVIYRTLVDTNGFDAAQLVTQPGTLLLALVLRIYIGRARGVPMRFAVRAETRLARSAEARFRRQTQGHLPDAPPSQSWRRSMKISPLLIGLAIAAGPLSLAPFAAAAPDNTLGMAMMSVSVSGNGTLNRRSGVVSC